MWPDFEATDLAAAVEEFRHRDRRFGSLGSIAADAS
jgi:undecaprenyl diphosphate synthase